MRCWVIEEHNRRYPIRLMCRALAISTAGYYAWRGRPEGRRMVANRTLLITIRVIHHESRRTYGNPRILQTLVQQGHTVGENRVVRLGLRCRQSLLCRHGCGWRILHRRSPARHVSPQGLASHSRRARTGTHGGRQ